MKIEGQFKKDDIISLQLFNRGKIKQRKAMQVEYIRFTLGRALIPQVLSSGDLDCAGSNFFDTCSSLFMTNPTEFTIMDILDHAPGMIYHYRLYPDGRSCFPFTSNAIRQICGIGPEDVAADASIVFEMIHPDDLERVKASILESARTLNDWKCEFRVRTPASGEQWLLGHSSPRRLEDGSVLWSGFITNISSRKKIEEELTKTTRLYAVTAKINEMIIHSRYQQQVFEESCKIAVGEGGFQLAWIGLVDPLTQTVQPITSSGPGVAYLKEIGEISIRADHPAGRGPTGIAIREARAVVNNAITTNPDYELWITAGAKRGFASSITLPIRFQGAVIGSLNLYSSTVRFFNTMEVELLEKIVHSISFAIDAIDSERKHHDAQELLKKSEEMFSAITNLSPDIISVLNSKGELVFNSPAALRIHGYSNDDLVGQNTMDFIHPADRDYIAAEMEKLISHPNGFANVQYRYKNKDGTYSWMEATCLNQLNNPLVEGIITISRDINQRKKLEEDLRTSLSIRDEFLSIASHELKTPLTSLKLQLQMLNNEAGFSKSRIDYGPKLNRALNLSSRQVDRITGLVDNLLDVTRIQAGKLNINYESFNLSEVLEDTLEGFLGLCKEAGCDQVLHIEKNIIGSWDRGRVEQVFVNLISNAIKYAPGKPIEISLQVQGNHVLFSVKDFGPGIELSKHQSIFERFERGPAPRYTSGLGLGLFIVKQIIDSHHGSIRLESKVGEGSCFTVNLPLGPML